MANQDEQWASIEGFSNYEVSDKGKIRSKTRTTWHKGSKTNMKIRGKMMRQRWNKACKCYFLDLIDNDKRRRTVYPHKEVAKAFVKNENPSDFTMIIHKDNNPRNNKADNLQWMSASEHMKWQFEVGNKNNYKVWKTRKKRYKNGFKPDTVLPGRPKKVKTTS